MSEDPAAAGSAATGIHHVGIAVHDLDAAVARYSELFAATLELRRELPEQQVEAASLHVGTSLVELVAPLVAGEGAVDRFLARRGEGLHHVAYSVADVRQALAHAEATGGRLVDSHPRIGLHGTEVAFLHPSSAHGVLTEFVQAQASIGN